MQQWGRAFRPWCGRAVSDNVCSPQRFFWSPPSIGGRRNFCTFTIRHLCVLAASLLGRAWSRCRRLRTCAQMGLNRGSRDVQGSLFHPCTRDGGLRTIFARKLEIEPFGGGGRIFKSACFWNRRTQADGAGLTMSATQSEQFLVDKCGRFNVASKSVVPPHVVVRTGRAQRIPVDSFDA